jgi:hypothetical protein
MNIQDFPVYQAAWLFLPSAPDVSQSKRAPKGAVPEASPSGSAIPQKPGLTDQEQEAHMAHIQIIDLPCGYGKSSMITASFDKRKKYIAVVPYLSEVSRFKTDAKRHSDFILTEPNSSGSNKSDHCEKLIRAGKSIACTHALFYRLGTLATQPTGVVTGATFKPGGVPTIEVEHLLADYNLIIDEVVNPFDVEQSVRRVDFEEDYLGLGLAEELPDGRIVPTALWDEKYEQRSRTFNSQLYEKAKSGGLYRLGKDLFVLTIPMELLLKPKSVTIYTYLSEGSLLLHFLRKLRKERPGEFTLTIDYLGKEEEAAWREDVANALTVKSIRGLEQQKWNHRAQLKTIKKHAECASLGHELRQFKNSEFYGVKLNTVMMTCAREVWHANKSGERPKAGRLAMHTRMFGHPQKTEQYNPITQAYDDKWTTTGVNFVPNTTRGTNAHTGCTTAVYLYDQNPNPQLVTFLGIKQNTGEARHFSDAYALTELVQWLFRSAIRVGGVNRTARAYEPRRRVTLHMPSERMRNLLLNWLLSGRVCSGPVSAKGQKQIELLARLEGRQSAMAA